MIGSLTRVRQEYKLTQETKWHFDGVSGKSMINSKKLIKRFFLNYLLCEKSDLYLVNLLTLRNQKFPLTPQSSFLGATLSPYNWKTENNVNLFFFEVKDRIRFKTYDNFKFEVCDKCEKK